MREYMISSIDEKHEFAKFDTALAIMECYLKQADMQMYFEAAATTTDAPAPAADPSPQPQPNAQPSVSPIPESSAAPQQQANASQQINGNMNVSVNANTLVQILMKLIDALVAAADKFIQAAATKAVVQQTIKQENEIDQTIDQAVQQGKIDPNDDKLVDELLAPAEGEQPNPEDSKPEVVERKKKLVKCVLVGDFTGAGILSPASIDSLKLCVVILNDLVNQATHMKGKDPTVVCKEITEQLKKNNTALSTLHGNNARSQTDKYGTSQKMSKKSFRESEQVALKLIDEMRNQLKRIDQMYKQGGFFNAIGNAFTKDLAAKTVATDAYKELQKALSTIRNSMETVMRDIQLVREINSKMLKKLNVVIVNGVNGTIAYSNRKSVQDAGVTAQMLEKQDKGRLSTFNTTNGADYMNASAAYKWNPNAST